MRVHTHNYKCMHTDTVRVLPLRCFVCSFSQRARKREAHANNPVQVSKTTLCLCMVWLGEMHFSLHNSPSTILELNIFIYLKKKLLVLCSVYQSNGVNKILPFLSHSIVIIIIMIMISSACYIWLQQLATTTCCILLVASDRQTFCLYKEHNDTCTQNTRVEKLVSKSRV